MAGSVVLRRARSSDKDRLVELWFRLSADGHTADVRYVLAAHAGEAAVDFVEGWVTGAQPTWVAEADGQVVAFIVTKRAAAHVVLELPETLVITDAYVLDEYRRRGIARGLFETVRDHAETEGVTALEVGTLANDNRAVAFWRSVGFGDWRVALARSVD